MDDRILESSNFRLLLWFAGGLLLANLFLMNGITTFWSGAETALLLAVEDGQATFSLPRLAVGLIADLSATDPFLVRSVGPIFFLLTLIMGWFWGQKIFGRQTTLYAMLLLAGSFLWPNISKLAAGDLWLLCSHFAAFLMAILYLKQPVWSWRIGFYLAAIGSILIHPLSSVIFLLVLVTALYFFHRKGKQLWKLNPWIIIILTAVVFFFLQGNNWRSQGFVMDFFGLSWIKYLLANLLGVLPWIGFVAAGIFDSLKKRKKGEEFGGIMLIALVAGLLSQSPIIGVIFAIWGGKHLNDYFLQNYPYGSIVKALSVLHLIFAFCLASFLMMRGFYEFKGQGFRTGLLFSFSYWVPTFLLIIGLYGRNQRLVISGSVLTSMLATFMFWYQLNPLLESKRNLPQRVVQVLEEQKITSGAAINLVPSLSATDNLQLYLKQKDFPPNSTSADQFNNLDQEGIYLIDQTVAVDSTMTQATIEGWTDGLKPKKWHLQIRE